ncbi:hypothetical protein ABW20_dc0101007 [Dactylellina cionopaga]|nr:hypothetical protein ABW20_dc0101007 [Dactylellina cionopaga]
MESLQQSKPSGITSFPAELHLNILSHLRVEDQISAGFAYSVWQTLVAKSEFLRKLRYSVDRPTKHEHIHPLLSPETSWLGLTTQAGVIKAYNIWKFPLKNSEEVRESGRFKHLVNGDEVQVLTCLREYADFDNPTSKLDISSCPLFEEPFFSPYIQLEVPETDQRKPTPEYAYLKQMLKGFPISVYTSEQWASEREFHTFSMPCEQIPRLTLRGLLEFIAKSMGEILEKDEGRYLGRGLWIRPPPSHRSEFGLRMDPKKEYDILIDQNFFKGSNSYIGEVGVLAIIIPCDDEERRDAVENISRRKASRFAYC